jgi:hypothetical protein
MDEFEWGSIVVPRHRPWVLVVLVIAALFWGVAPAFGIDMLSYMGDFSRTALASPVSASATDVAGNASRQTVTYPAVTPDRLFADLLTFYDSALAKKQVGWHDVLGGARTLAPSAV